ncbi:MAG: thiamine pyrophosphate-binding protein [Chloroflexi bacterium]|nr:thiamine pyrophosphate-binding protein [Chloroflexota bacterium]
MKEIFMLTGNGSMYMNDAISRSGLKYFCARNEAAAPMMAEAYARVKQSLGAVCVTSGPGSTNAIPGLAEAWVDAAPIMVLSGQVQRDHTTLNAGLKDLRSFGTQEINVIPIVEPLTKYAVMVNEPESIRYHLEKAYYLANEGRPGPVWLDIPMDIQYADIDPETLDGFTPDDPLRFEPAQTGKYVDQIIDLMKQARRPLVIAGNGIRQGNAQDDLMKFLDGSGIPVIFSRLGQDLMPFSHPLNMGQAGIKGSKYCTAIMKQADLVITFGCRLSVQLVGHKMDAFSDDAKVVMVDLLRDELDKPGVPISHPMHADVKEVLTGLNQHSNIHEHPNWNEWAESCAELKTSNPMVTPEYLRDPIDLYYFMSRLDAISDEHHLFVTDAGSNYYIGGQVLHFEYGQREITSGTFAAMGLSIPLAIGSAIAAPNSQILAVTGDGSLELNVQELKTMSHYGLNIKLFVINNGGYVSMRNWQDGFFEGRRIEGEEATGSGTLNLEKVAAAFDVEFTRIEGWKNVDDALAQVLSTDHPEFVEVVCNPEQKIVEPMADLSFDVSRA